MITPHARDGVVIEASDSPRNRPPLQQRIIVAVAIGVAFGLLSFASTFRHGYRDQDFRIFWLAGKLLLGDGNPYRQIVLTEGGPAFFYPIVAAVLVAPLTWIPVRVAGPVFVTLSCTLLAYVVTRKAWWPLLMFLSGSMLVSALAANFAPLLTLAFFAAPAVWLGAVKPNIGLALLIYRPSVRSALIMLGVTFVSLLVMPSWPAEWFAAVRRSRVHYSPILASGGPLLLLALVKWRRPEARLIAAMAILPSSPVVYEALPLFAIPSTWKEMILLSATTLAGYFYMRASTWGTESPFDFMERGRSVVLWTCYIPTLLIVLRRPNSTVS